MTQTNNSVNSIQGNLTTSLAISGYCLPISKFSTATLSTSAQNLTTISTELSGMNITLPEQGVYEIGANVVEDISTITANLTANYSSYTLWDGPKGTWVTRTAAGARYWFGITISSDGNKLAACSQGYIYTSNNFGASWTEQTGSDSRSWAGIVGSSDLTKLIGRLNPGNLFLSIDSGVTWTSLNSAGSRSWSGFSMSSDGNNICACDSTPGYIYTSSNLGSTWIAQTNSGSRAWSSITSSSDGKNIAACVNNGYIYTNTNYGSGTWTEQTSGGSRIWSDICSSSDGKYIAACVTNGYVYTNTNYGSGAWIQQTALGSKLWSSIACSSDGSRIAVEAIFDNIYTSNDYGSSWITHTGIIASPLWQSICMSSDGTRIATSNNDGSTYIYTYDSQIEKTKRYGSGISTLNVSPTGMTSLTNSFNWIYNNFSSNTLLKIYAKKNTNTTGDWIVRSDSSGRSSMYARLIS